MKKEQTVVKTKIVMDMTMKDNPNGGKKAKPFSRQKQYKKVWTLNQDLIKVLK